jgi:hypothetical protein
VIKVNKERRLKIQYIFPVHQEAEKERSINPFTDYHIAGIMCFLFMTTFYVFVVTKRIDTCNYHLIVELNSVSALALNIYVTCLKIS